LVVDEAYLTHCVIRIGATVTVTRRRVTLPYVHTYASVTLLVILTVTSVLRVSRYIMISRSGWEIRSTLTIVKSATAMDMLCHVFITAQLIPFPMIITSMYSHVRIYFISRFIFQLTGSCFPFFSKLQLVLMNFFKNAIKCENLPSVINAKSKAINMLGSSNS